jgi:uncharacterized UBP type Zn finger protein
VPNLPAVRDLPLDKLEPSLSLNSMRRRTRRRDVNSSPQTCEHLAAAVDAAEPDALTPGRCAECAEDGDDTWAHLRMCLTCGHVGCCDSSPHQHANAHFHQTGHAVMRSVEPGENWRWCYVDIQLG